MVISKDLRIESGKLSRHFGRVILIVNLKQLDITISLQEQSVKALPEEAGIEETVAWSRVIDI
jgi:hypothetical protein